MHAHRQLDSGPLVDCCPVRTVAGDEAGRQRTWMCFSTPSMLFSNSGFTLARNLRSERRFVSRAATAQQVALRVSYRYVSYRSRTKGSDRHRHLPQLRPTTALTANAGTAHCSELTPWSHCRSMCPGRRRSPWTRRSRVSVTSRASTSRTGHGAMWPCQAARQANAHPDSPTQSVMVHMRAEWDRAITESEHRVSTAGEAASPRVGPAKAEMSTPCKTSCKSHGGGRSGTRLCVGEEVWERATQHPAHV